MAKIRVHFEAVELSEDWFDVASFQADVLPQDMIYEVANRLNKDIGEFIMTDAGGLGNFIRDVEIVSD